MTYRENKGDATSHSLGAIEVSFGAEEEVLLAFGRLPGDDSGAIEQHFDRFARR